MWRVRSPIPVGMEIASEFIKVEGDSMGFMGTRGGLDKARIERNLAHKRKFPGIGQRLKRRLREQGRAGASLHWQLFDQFTCIAENRVTSGVPILDVKNRVV